jgi:predicted SnoaL-like aldol condensation-catalyzing enzyme
MNANEGSMNASTLTSHKQAATDFLELIATGRVREAFEKYTDPTFRHHNVYFTGDAASLAAAMEENARANPDKFYEPRMSIEEGSRVAVFGRVRHKPGDPDYALVHIFRFDDDRIVEMWDVAQELPADSPNRNGAF